MKLFEVIKPIEFFDDIIPLLNVDKKRIALIQAGTVVEQKTPFVQGNAKFKIVNSDTEIYVPEKYLDEYFKYLPSSGLPVGEQPK